MRDGRRTRSCTNDGHAMVYLKITVPTFPLMKLDLVSFLDLDGHAMSVFLHPPLRLTTSRS